MAFTWVTNAHEPSPQPTACWSTTSSLTTATGRHSLNQEVWVWNLYFLPAICLQHWLGVGIVFACWLNEANDEPKMLNLMEVVIWNYFDWNGHSQPPMAPPNVTSIWENCWFSLADELLKTCSKVTITKDLRSIVLFLSYATRKIPTSAFWRFCLRRR